MEKELHNLESLMVALGVGPGRQWAKDHIIASAWASQYHQLGAAIAHIEAHRNSQAYKQALYALTGLLISFRLCKGSESFDLAKSGLDWWIFGHCPACMGAGVTHEQQVCGECGGSTRVKSSGLDRKCGLLIDAACDQYDAAIAKTLKGNTYETHIEPKRSRMEFSEEGARWTPPAFCHD